MGWSVGYDSNWQRDIGYGVPATCDHPGCKKSVCRGLANVCGGEPYGGDEGCGLYFCAEHLSCARKKDGTLSRQLCSCCIEGKEPFDPKPDTRRWLRHKLKDKTWKPWRDDNPGEVEKIEAALKQSAR